MCIMRGFGYAIRTIKCLFVYSNFQVLVTISNSFKNTIIIKIIPWLEMNNLIMNLYMLAKQTLCSPDN